MNRKKLIEAKNSDYDCRIYYYPIGCQVTEQNKSRLQRYAESKTCRMSGHCCDHDCCGHLYAETVEVVPAGKRGFALKISKSYNY